MDEHTLALLAELHTENERQGPGSPAAFAQALALCGIDTTAPLRIADIGCGTGSATLELLRATNAHVTAVDFIPAFLETLKERVAAAGLAERVTTLEADMGALPFDDASFDMLWAEGAIYNIGFARGVEEWKRFLKQGGVLVVSEITWLTPEVPTELKEYWQGEYPEVAPASEKIGVLERNGYTPIGYFVLTPDCWLANYYEPLERAHASFLARHNNAPEAREIVAADQHESELYRKYQDYYSYGVYIATKRV